LDILSKDTTSFIDFPALVKPFGDISFLLDYISDELQFKGPHFARTVKIINKLSD
jgi:hypothetical protein